MIRLTGAGFAAAAIAAAGSSAPAEAQTLSQGDFTLYSVYRPHGGFAADDSACLERQRAAIRRFSNDGKPHYAPPSTHPPPIPAPAGPTRAMAIPARHRVLAAAFSMERSHRQ